MRRAAEGTADALIRLTKSRKEFSQQYRAAFLGRTKKASQLYCSIVEKAVEAIGFNDSEALLQNLKYLYFINQLETFETVQAFMQLDENPLKRTNFIILTCAVNREALLGVLFENEVILKSLLSASPIVYDENHHDAFYYAMRSTDLRLFDMLLARTPEYYYEMYQLTRVEILAKTFEEIRMRGIAVAAEIETLIQKLLVKDRGVGMERVERNASTEDIQDRLRFIVECIDALQTMPDIDGGFLENCKLIAMNCYHLKHLLICTLDRIPWEEFEFFLVKFIISHRGDTDKYVHFADLQREQLIAYLAELRKMLTDEAYFAKVLAANDLRAYELVPFVSRKEVVGELTERHPVLQSFFKTYEVMRDVHSLRIIYFYTNLCRDTADMRVETLEEQVTIFRTLQIIEQFTRSTLMDPRMSPDLAEFMMNTIEEQTRHEILQMDNTVTSMQKREEILSHKLTSAPFFTRVLKDIIVICRVARCKIKEYEEASMKTLLEMIIACESADQLQADQRLWERAFGTTRLVEADVYVSDDEDDDDRLITDMMLAVVSLNSSKMVSDHQLEQLKYYAQQRLNAIATQQTQLNYLDELKSKQYGLAHAINKYNQLEMDQLLNDEKLIQFKMGTVRSVLDVNTILERQVERLTLLFVKHHDDIMAMQQDKVAVLLELLILDILTIMEADGRLTDNNQFIDECAPILIGKAMQQYLLDKGAFTFLLSFDIKLNLVIYAHSLQYFEYAVASRMVGALPQMNARNYRAKKSMALEVLHNQAQMFQALASGNVARCQKVMHQGGDVYAVDKLSRQSSYHYAASCGSLEITKYLDSDEVTKDTTDIYGQTAVHIAARRGDVTLINFFGKNGWDIDGCGKMRQSPLHVAAMHGHVGVIRALLKFGVDVKMRNFCKYAALHIAAHNNQLEAFACLIEKEIHVDFQEVAGGYTCLHLAAESGNVDLVRYIIDIGADVNAQQHSGGQALHTAALFGNMDICRLLVEKGCDINAVTPNGSTPLSNATTREHKEVVQYLVEHGAEVNAHRSNRKVLPPVYAAATGDGDILRILLERGADLNVANTEQISTLHKACLSGRYECVKLLVEYGAEVNHKNENGVTALHVACSFGDIRIVEYLLERGADPIVRNRANLLPVHMAAQSGHLEIVKIMNYRRYDDVMHAAAMGGACEVIEFLLGEGMSVSAAVSNTQFKRKSALEVAITNDREEAAMIIINSGKADGDIKNFATALHVACKRNQVRIVRALIEHHVNLNAFDANNISALHYAILGKRYEIVEMLVEAGCCLTLQCEETDIPLLLASQMHQTEVISLLLKHMPVDQICRDVLLVNVIKGNDEAVRFILDVYETLYTKGDAPISRLLHLAIHCGHSAIAKMLLDAGADVNEMTNCVMTPLAIACRNGHEHLVKLLIQHGARYDSRCGKDGLSPMHFAIKTGKPNVVKVLLYSKFSLTTEDAHGRPALHYAIVMGQVASLEVILDYPCTTNNPQALLSQLTFCAASARRPEVMQFLVKRGADVLVRDANGSLPIHYAAKQGCTTIVTYLLDKTHLLVNERGAHGQTVLHCAAILDNAELVQLLIDRGANINALDKERNTPLHLATVYCNPRVVRLLLRHGAIFDAPNKFNVVPLDISSTNEKSLANSECYVQLMKYRDLFRAVQDGRTLDVERLLCDDVSANARKEYGYSALHMAASYGHTPIVKLLLQHGADINVMVRDNITPLNKACRGNRYDIVLLLLQYGAYHHVVNPMELRTSTNPQIARIINIISECFSVLEQNDRRLVIVLRAIKDTNIMRAIMGSRNAQNRTLMACVILQNYKYQADLEMLMQSDLSQTLTDAIRKVTVGDVEDAAALYTIVYERRKVVFGINNPVTLHTHIEMMRCLFKMDAFEIVVDQLSDLSRAYERALGKNHECTLQCRVFEALVNIRVRRFVVALSMYEKILPVLLEVHDADHEDVLETQYYMAEALEGLNRHSEALRLHRIILEKRIRIFGPDNYLTLASRYSVAELLARIFRNVEALAMFRDVLQTQRVVAVSVEITLRTMQNICNMLYVLHRDNEYIARFEEMFVLKRTLMGDDHPETLFALMQRTLVHYRQGELLPCYRICTRKLTVFREKLSMWRMLSELEAAYESICKLPLFANTLNAYICEEKLCHAAKVADMPTIIQLLRYRPDVNRCSWNGFAPMHFAVENGHGKVLEVLFRAGALLTIPTTQSYTLLHLAALKNHANLIETSIRLDPSVKDIINQPVGRTLSSPLHIAIAMYYYDVVLTLLKYGACYTQVDCMGQTAKKLAKFDKPLRELIRRIITVFDSAASGERGIVEGLEEVGQKELMAITNARNKNGKTLLQVAMMRKHCEVADLINLLRNKNQ